MEEILTQKEKRKKKKEKRKKKKEKSLQNGLFDGMG